MKLEIIVCQTGMGRHAPELRPMVEARGARLGTVECFDKCETCELFLIARIDGVTARFRNGDDLACALDVLAEEES